MITRKNYTKAFKQEFIELSQNIGLKKAAKKNKVNFKTASK